MSKLSPTWAALGIAVILSGFLGAAFFSGKTYAEKKIIAKEHKALISYVEKSKAISEKVRIIHGKVNPKDSTKVRGGVVDTVIDLDRLQ